MRLSGFFHIEGPYQQINPVKWLGNIAGIALVIGGILLLKNRLAKKDQPSSYWDWYLVGLVLALGLTGLLTEMLRLGGMYGLSAFCLLSAPDLHLEPVCLYAVLQAGPHRLPDGGHGLPGV